ncbi:MAG: hypothetical protein V3S94_07420, partial [Gammaproteobacteria bacterium]
EIEVHRRMGFPDDEKLYVTDEMLDNHIKLIDHARWLSQIASFESFVEPPTIEIPEIDNDVLSYTVAALCVVSPN